MKQSMLDAGYSLSYSTTQSTHKLRELAPKIVQIMDRAGLTDNHLINKLKLGLSSTKPVLTKDGITDYEDFSTQHKYLETGLKLRGHLKDKVDVNVNLDLADRLYKARMNARLAPVEAEVVD
jgi:hypothetical protein